MEMEFKDNGRRRKLFLVLGVVLAVASGGAAFYLSSQGAAQAAPVPTRTVLVAVREIPARTLVDTGMLTTRELPHDPSLAQAVADPDLIVGRLTGVTIYANQAITPNLLATTAVGAEFSILAPTETIGPDTPHWRAVSISVPKDRAVGGHVEVGQRVDLFVTVQLNVFTEGEDGKLVQEPDPETGYATEKTTKITWEDVEILSKDEDADLYILKVDLHQAEEINHILASGNNGFSIALRPDGDTRLVDRSGYGETIDRIITQYNLPVPRIIDLDSYPQPSAQPLPVNEDPLPSPDSSNIRPPAAEAVAPAATPAPSAAASAAP